MATSLQRKMATWAECLGSTPSFLGLFFLFTGVCNMENTTSFDLNSTGFDYSNFTFMEEYTTPQPGEWDWTGAPAEPSSRPPEAPPPELSTEPLPVSGGLPPLVSSVDSICPCDEQQGVCDLNCCCDRECNEDVVALFTGCTVHTVSGSRQLCSRDVASYSLRSRVDGYAELQSSVRKESSYDVLCIQTQNRVNTLSHPSPALPSESNFDSLFEQFTSFIFRSGESGSQQSAAQPQASYGYLYGDVMATAAGAGQRGTFLLPAPSITAGCMDTSPAAFLKDQSSVCSRRVVLEQDCGSLPGLSISTYTSVQLFASKSKDAAVVPVELASVLLQAVDGTQTELQMSDGENLRPALVSPSLCANVVLKVIYVMRYNAAGEVVNATASLLLGFVSGAVLSLQQEFHITFVQEDGEEVAVRYSGNPGYVVGLPVVSGTRTADGIARSVDPRDTVSVLRSAENQDCLQGAHQRSPVLFGHDSVSGCTLRLEDAFNCTLIAQVLLDVLRGPNPPRYVASFGNSPLDRPLDWVPIQSSFSPGEGQSCSIPLSLHLEIQWTKYGSLVNPQAQIVSIREEIQTNLTSLELLSGGSSILTVRSSVAFVPVSAAAAPGYRAMPTINTKLPFDFFFPFV